MTGPRASLPRIYLQVGQDRRIALGHPWAYSNEIRMDADAKALPAGSLATLHRTDGKPLGVGSFNPHTLIAFRIFDHNAAATIDEAFFVHRLRRAVKLRERLFAEPCWRMVHAEADGLPGLVCDRFGDVLVMQMNTAGMQALAEPLLAAAGQVLAPAAVVLRNDSPAREMEGLDRHGGVVHGTVDGPIELRESGLVFLADVLEGQKTGWFYDQRDSRAFVAPLARGASLLDAYCYTGGFAVAAAGAGAADVVGIDSSEPALALARRAAQANGVETRCTFRRAEVFGELERLGRFGERFRVVVADPPAFVKSKKDLGSGLRGYRKLARLAAALVEPEGFLFVASCSHNVEPAALMGEVVHGAAAAGRSGRIIREAKAAADHPVHIHLPETAYLKSVLLQLD
ncbi:MAG TPA: class I SAM-dependent rRNA methyltransferase [Rhodospirillales bacterium]|nr:class I SAM-dependent rRNA methyltransferase [Rhodospirillales bacterium]